MISASYVGKGTFLKPVVISGCTHNGLYLASGAKFLNLARHSDHLKINPITLQNLWVQDLSIYPTKQVNHKFIQYMIQPNQGKYSFQNAIKVYKIYIWSNQKYAHSKMTVNKVSWQRFNPSVCLWRPHQSSYMYQLGAIQCPDLLHKAQAWLPAAHHLHHTSLALKPHPGQGLADSRVQILPEELFPSSASSGWSWVCIWP